jgi:type I restriction enzyme R subunit
MYLDKPMRDHVLLQAVARVNRPYEDEDAGLVKPHGFVLDFVGVFDKLEKALAFDSDEVNAVVKDIALLKDLFAHKMTNVVPPYLQLVSPRFDDKDVDHLIEHFRDKDPRQEFFKQFKETEMLYEIISPDAFLRPYLDDYASLAAIFSVVQNAYGRKVYIDRAFQKKTNELVQRHVDAGELPPVTDFVEIDPGAIDVIKTKQGGDAARVINLIKSIERAAEEASQDPFLIALADRAKAVRENYEDRQVTTSDALQELLEELEADQERRERQAISGLDAITHFVLTELQANEVRNAEGVSRRAAQAFTKHPDWRVSEAALREVRKDLTFAVLAEVDKMEKVVGIVDHLIDVLTRGER